MSAKRSLDNLRTWIEIDARAARKNYETFRTLIGPKVNLWAVVKSNAYGHGLFVFSRLMDRFGIDGFCVDALVEGLKLRMEGVKRPILVLGPTLPNLLHAATAKRITLTVSNFDALKAVLAFKNPPQFHLKVDTGMHRQGFYLEELAAVLRKIQMSKSKCQNQLKGIYTHFASAKDINYPTYTEKQFEKFQKSIRMFARAGYNNLMRHCAATGATLISKKYHCDAVRLGIGLYGLWPSKELEVQNGIAGAKVNLAPVLLWRTVVSEVKKLRAGDFVGYDLRERVMQPTQLAILPVGYWHGYPRALGMTGPVLIGGRRARALGMVSMDLMAVDATGIAVRPGMRATLIGKDGAVEIRACDIAHQSGTTHYEFLTRLNPLMERVLVPRSHPSL